MEGNFNGAGGANKYQYNGKELNSDFGLEWNDYKFRWYDPSVSRFWSIDALATKFTYYSPYQFAGNKVPNAIDLDGLEELLVRDIGYGTLNKNEATQENTIRDREGNSIAYNKFGDNYWYSTDNKYRWTAGMKEWVNIQEQNVRLADNFTTSVKIGLVVGGLAPLAASNTLVGVGLRHLAKETAIEMIGEKIASGKVNGIDVSDIGVSTASNFLGWKGKTLALVSSAIVDWKPFEADPDKRSVSTPFNSTNKKSFNSTLADIITGGVAQATGLTSGSVGRQFGKKVESGVDITISTYESILNSVIKEGDPDNKK